jgi:hypothetical protein
LFAGPGFEAPSPNPELALVRGQTYVFSNVTGSHPFQIAELPVGGIGGSLVQYDKGVTNNNTIGDVVFTVPFDAPSGLVYNCTVHPDMIGVIYISSQIPNEFVATSDLEDVSDTFPDTVGQVLTWDGTEYVPTVPSGGGGGAVAGTYTENTIPVSQIIAAHTFQESSPNATEQQVNMASWAGTQGNIGYGPQARRFWDFSGSSTEAGYAVDWPVEADTQGIIIQFDFRWDGETSTDIPVIFGLGDDTTNDGTTGGFSLRVSTNGSSQYAYTVDEQVYYSDAFIYLSDDSITDEARRLIVATKPYKYGFDFTDDWQLSGPLGSAGDRPVDIGDGRFHQITFILHTDDNGAQDGRFSCYVDGTLVDFFDRRTPDPIGNVGPLVTGGAGFDKLFIGAPRGASYDESYGLDNVYVAYGDSAEPLAGGIEYTENKTYGDPGNGQIYPTNPILTERTFRSISDDDIYIGNIKGVSSAPALGHGQVLGWDPTYEQYEPMDGMVIRDVNYGGYGTYPYASSDILYLSQRTGNVVVNLEFGRMAVYTGEVDYETGNGGWMEWSINPLFPA